MNIVLLGAPGAGKGTQAKPLSKRYGIPHISTGDIFRAEIGRGSALGVQVSEYVKSGRLVPDALVVEVMGRRIEQSDCGPGFLLDGFPRTVAQAESLDEVLTQLRRPLDRVVYLNLPEAEVIRRLSSRSQCSACGQVYNMITQPPRVPDACDADGKKLVQREDDRAETVEKRLRVYNDLTEPLIAYYHGLGLLETVSAAPAADQVFAAIEAALSRPASA